MLFMRCKAWGFLLLLMFAFNGCEGEVPVAVHDPKQDEPKPSGPKETGFVPLTFADFSAFPPMPMGDEPTWFISDLGDIQTTGKPRGYLYTKKPYSNFTFRCEFRFLPEEEPLDAAAMDKYNTGFLIYVPNDHKIWPRSLEVQGRYDQIGQVKKNARDMEFNGTLDDQAAREKARRPVGEWNAVEIVSKDGAVTAFLNGEKVSACDPGDVDTGYIGLQAEDFPVEFRNLSIRED